MLLVSDPDPNDPFAHLPEAQPNLLALPLKGEKGRPASSGCNPQTVGEARLLAINWKDPRNGAFFQQKLKWMQAYRDSAAWSKTQLQERRHQLYQDTQTLKALLANPPDDGDGPKWWAMFQRLRGWMGHLEGLDSACQSRR